MRTRTKHELRCFCSRGPLLAVYGLDQRGKIYVHVKIYKQNRIYGEILVIEGVVRLHCRECLRWHTVRLVTPTRAELVEDSEPPRLPHEAVTGP